MYAIAVELRYVTVPSSEKSFTGIPLLLGSSSWVIITPFSFAETDIY